jgi:hypothetical protein
VTLGLRRTVGAAAIAAAVWVAAGVVGGGCDPRALLAQSTLFAGVRHDLVEECCACLARRGTRAPGASCGEAQLLPDGGTVVPDGADVAPEDSNFSRDDGDDVIDDDEIPCSCGVNAGACVTRLEAGGRMIIPGACVDQPNNLFDAPCESACKNVVTFDPVSSPE